MAKRLSKALRGKRRWIGVIVSAEIKSKQDALKSLEMLFTDSELGGIRDLRNTIKINLVVDKASPLYKLSYLITTRSVIFLILNKRNTVKSSQVTHRVGR